MGLEAATFVSQLNANNPVVGDSKTQGDDHFRLIKSVLQSNFPNASKAFFFPTSVVAQTGTVNVIASDERKIIPVDASAGAVVINLAGGLNDGFEIIVVKVDSSVNAVTIDPDGATLINGQATITLDSQFESVSCKWMGGFSAWLGMRSVSGNPFNLDQVEVTYSGLLNLTSTEGVKLPVGTTAQRPSVPVSGDVRVNSTDVALEYYDGVRWVQVRELVTQPGWYASLSASVPILAGDVLAATSLTLHPFANGVGLYSDGVLIKPFPFFTPLTLNFNAGGHVANTLYDFFLWFDAGVTRVVTGPAWANSGDGTGTRSTGLERLMGVWVNTGAMTGRNGASTFSVGDKQAVYLGTVFIDSVAGQVSCHRSYGQLRKWGVWNYWNRQKLYLKGGDGTASWNYGTNVIRESNADGNNKLTTLAGLREEVIDVEFNQNLNYVSAGSVVFSVGVGVNVVNAFSGKRGFGRWSDDPGQGGISGAGGGDAKARFLEMLPLGVNAVTSLERADVSVSVSVLGTETNMLLSACWKG